MRDDGEVETEGESNENSMPPLKDDDEDRVKYPVVGETLVVRHTKNAHIRKDDVREWQENIFHTSCHINNKVCSMIIYGGTCTNVASTTLVER